MDVSEFTRRHPRLFHLAHGDAWPSLAEHGLLSVRSIVQRSALPQSEREAMLTQHRPVSVSVDVPGLGSVVVRDQGPLNMAKLAACLTGGMTPAQWLTMLNSMAFLFPSEATLATLYEKYRADAVTVLELDSRSLVAEYGSLIRLASINTGATVYAAAKRGADTFRGIAQFDARKQVKEVAVMDGIPDLARHVRRVERREPDGRVVPLSETPASSAPTSPTAGRPATRTPAR